MADDRAPALRIRLDDADVDRSAFPRLNGAGSGAIGENEVVALIAGVFQGHDEPVASRHVDARRRVCEPSDGDLDLRHRGVGFDCGVGRGSRSHAGGDGDDESNRRHARAKRHSGPRKLPGPALRRRGRFFDVERPLAQAVECDEGDARSCTDAGNRQRRGSRAGRRGCERDGHPAVDEEPSGRRGGFDAFERASEPGGPASEHDRKEEGKRADNRLDGPRPDEEGELNARSRPRMSRVGRSKQLSRPRQRGDHDPRDSRADEPAVAH